MNKDLKNKLVQTLKKNLDTFLWTVVDMIGVDP